MDGEHGSSDLEQAQNAIQQEVQMAIIKEESSLPDLKVQIVSSFPDLYVYVTKNKSEAKGKDAVWYFDNSFPDRKVKFVTSFTDLKILYVVSAGQAGWKNKSHRLQNRIG